MKKTINKIIIILNETKEQGFLNSKDERHRYVAKKIYNEFIKPEIIAKEHFRKQRDNGLSEFNAL